MQGSKGVEGDDDEFAAAGAFDILAISSAQESHMAHGKLQSMRNAAETICLERSEPAVDVT